MSGYQGGPRGGRGPQGAGPVRRTSGGFARASAAPYGSHFRSAEQHVSTPVPEGQWKHDLFPRDSNLYAPTLNMAAPALSALSQSRPLPSPSLRPFGNATPAPRLYVAPAPVPQVVPTQPRVLAQRLALPTGPAKMVPSGPSLDVRGAREATRAKFQAEQKRKEEERRRREEEKMTREQFDRLVMVAGEEERGFVVQVEGLVFGTSAEDVQTAFGQYGVTTFCFIVNEESNDETVPLVARLVFERRADADTAVSKLDGAIADGRPLKVALVPATPAPAQQKAFVPAARAPAPVVRAAAPIVPVRPASRMHADELERLDPRTTPQTVYLSDDASSDVDMDVVQPVKRAIPTGPRGRGGRGNGRGGGVGRTMPAVKQQPKEVNLLTRLGMGNGQQQNGHGGGGGGGRGGRGSNKGAGGLLSRLS